MFSSVHFCILILIFTAIILALIYYTDPIFASGASGFIAFIIHYFYAHMAFKKVNARITLLQTKIELNH